MLFCPLGLVGTPKGTEGNGIEKRKKRQYITLQIDL